MKYSFAVLVILALLVNHVEATEGDISKHQKDAMLIWDKSETPGVIYTVYLNGEMLNEGILGTQLNVGQNAGLFAVTAVLDNTYSPKAFRVRPYGATNVRIVTTKTTIETITTITE